MVNKIPPPLPGQKTRRGSMDKSQSQRIQERNQAFLELHDNGYSQVEIWNMAIEAGWEIQLKSIGPRLSEAANSTKTTRYNLAEKIAQLIAEVVDLDEYEIMAAKAKRYDSILQAIQNQEGK